MSPLKLPLLSPPGFSIVAEMRPTSLLLRFRGNADMSSVEPLDGYLRAVHREAVALRLPAVIADFRAVEFMNSSCFKCFVEWLGRVQELPETSRYKIVFDSNRTMHWQRRSLNALRCFAMDVVTVEAR